MKDLINQAIIYLAPGLSLDGEYAHQCMRYVANRGYRLQAIFRDWGTVERSLVTGHATVAVVGYHEQGPGERTVELCAPVVNLASHRSQANTRRLPSAAKLSAHNDRFTTGRVRKILNGDVPAPSEMDPATLDALRRLWRRLGD